jgi:hypothetical protein
MTTLLFRTALAALPNAKIWDNFSQTCRGEVSKCYAHQLPSCWHLLSSRRSSKRLHKIRWVAQLWEARPARFSAALWVAGEARRPGP